MKIVRGERIEQGIEEDATYPQLRQNIDKAFPDTTKRQHATGEVTITSMKYVPFVGGVLQVHSTARSNGHDYAQTMIFTGVVDQPEGQEGGTTYTGSDNRQHTIQPIVLGGSRVKVNCGCLDFHYRFAMWNFDNDALSGAKPPLYQKKTNRPPVNPGRVPGVCKHIIKLVDTLRAHGLVS